MSKRRWAIAALAALLAALSTGPSSESGCWFRVYTGAGGHSTAAGNGFTVAIVDPATFPEEALAY